MSRLSRCRAVARRVCWRRMRATIAAITDPEEAERIASAARQAAREFREGMGR